MGLVQGLTGTLIYYAPEIKKAFFRLRSEESFFIYETELVQSVDKVIRKGQTVLDERINKDQPGYLSAI
jgi:hypothetical protein